MSDTKGLFHHSRNYLFANIATQALGFISMPVYTHLLSSSDYGVYSTFTAVVGVATPVLFLSTHTAISRYYFEAKSGNDFKRFVGTTIVLSSITFIFLSVLYFLFLPQLSLLLNFDSLLTLMVLPVCLFTVVDSLFEQIYGPMLKSGKVAVVASVRAYLAFGISVAAILLLQEKKYYGQVIGSIGALFFLMTYVVNQIRPYCKLSLDKKMVNYILSYSVPQVPYYLSGILLIQFSKIVISSFGGFAEVGKYNIAATIGGLMMVVISITHQAWNPYYMRYMTERDHFSIDHDVNLIWRVTLLCGGLLASFGYEIGYVLAAPEYHQYLYMIPLFVLGYVFYQWSYFYLRNVGFSKKTIWNTIIVFISGGFNVILNFVLIKKFGNIGAPVSLIGSYLLMLFVSYFVNKYILKEYTSPVRDYLLPMFVFLVFTGIVTTSYVLMDKAGYFLSFIFKVISLVILTVILFYPYKQQIVSFVREKVRR